MDFLKTHPYLIANLPVLLAVLMLARLARPRSYGRLSLLSGLICISTSVLVPLYNKSYWNPVRLGGWPVGIEDVSFSIAVGAMVWLLAAFFFRRRLTPKSFGESDHGFASRRNRVGCCFRIWLASLYCLYVRRAMKTNREENS